MVASCASDCFRSSIHTLDRSLNTLAFTLSHTPPETMRPHSVPTSNKRKSNASAAKEKSVAAVKKPAVTKKSSAIQKKKTKNASSNAPQLRRHHKNKESIYRERRRTDSGIRNMKKLTMRAGMRITSSEASSIAYRLAGVFLRATIYNALIYTNLNEHKTISAAEMRQALCDNGVKVF